jgi:parallel beta-helix repeat protein
MIRRFARVAFPSLVLTALVGAALAAPVAASSTHWVDDDGHAGTSGGCDSTASAATSIQAAITAAHRWDTIVVCPGTYVGPLSINKRALKVVADSSGTPVVQPNPHPDETIPLVSINRAPNALFKGFSLEFPTNGDCVSFNYGIRMRRSPGATVANNTLSLVGSGNTETCGYGLGIKIERFSRGAKITGNTLTDFAYLGIDFEGSARVHVNGNTLHFVHADQGSCGSNCQTTYGIVDDPGAGHGTITNNTITATSSVQPPLTYGIWTRRPNTTVSNNTVSYASFGIDLGGDADNTTVSGNTVSNSGYGVELEGSTTANTISGNTVSNSNFIGLFVSGGATGNTLTGNTSTGSFQYDCYDGTFDIDPAGVENTWTNDIGVTSYPSALDYQPPICLPSPI